MRLGGLDERFGLGFFDDDDRAERARRAGFELAVAHDLFINHVGCGSHDPARGATGGLRGSDGAPPWDVEN